MTPTHTHCEIPNSHALAPLPILHYEVDDLGGGQVYISVQYGRAFQGVVGDGTLFDPYDADGNPVYGWVGENYYPFPPDDGVDHNEMEYFGSLSEEDLEREDALEDDDGVDHFGSEYGYPENVRLKAERDHRRYPALRSDWFKAEAKKVLEEEESDCPF